MATRIMITFLFIPMLMLGCTRAAAGPVRTQDVVIAGETFHLELALNWEARHQGLSDRPTIAPDGGMLFVFPSADYQSFVMRRCLVPIDIIFLSSGGYIVAMHEMKVESTAVEALLTRYASGQPAQFAIELAGGTIRRLGLHRDDKIELPLERLVKQAH